MNVKLHHSSSTGVGPAFFTVIVPMYNMEQYIEECLKSVLDQSFHSVELIVVDDGSADGSVAKCLALMDRGHEYILLGQSQSGPNIARNLALEYASGRYVLFMDADDRLNSSALQILHDEMIRYPQTDVTSFGYTFFDDETGVVRAGACPKRRHLRGGDIFVEALAGKDFAGVCWNKCFRRTLLADNHISFVPDQVHGRDLLFSRTTALHAIDWRSLDAVVYESRFRSGSFSRSFSERNIQSAINVAQYHMIIFQDAAVSRGVLPELNYAIYRHLRYIVLLAAFRAGNYSDFKELLSIVRDSPLWRPTAYLFGSRHDRVVGRFTSLLAVQPALCWFVSRMLKRLDFEPY